MGLLEMQWRENYNQSQNMTKKYTKIQEELPDEQIDSKEPFVLHAEDSEPTLVSFSGKPKMSGCRIR